MPAWLIIALFALFSGLCGAAVEFALANSSAFIAKWLGLTAALAVFGLLVRYIVT
jgi:hypothetical protein